MSPFKPTGDKARWRVLYERLRKLEVGDVLTYEEMASLLMLDPNEDRHTIQMAMRRGALELERVDKHATDCIPNEGYRIVEATEHLVLARRHQRKAGKSLVRGRSKAVNVDFNEVDPETRKAFEVVATAFAAQLDFNRRLDIRQRNLETAVAAVTQRVDTERQRTEQEIADLQERLARLEQRRTSNDAHRDGQ